ncbi:MAG: hypothetical protein ACYCO9_09840 [Streptosporangiaceae bacterium]
MSRARRVLFSIITAWLLAAGGTTVALAVGSGPALRWSAARTGPGASPFGQLLNLGSGFTLQDGLVCPFPRDCTVFYRGPMTSLSPPASPAYTINLRGGRWGKPRQIPGFATVASPTYGCALPGTCFAAGARPETLSPLVDIAVAAVEVGGTWRTTKPVPGLASLGGNAKSYVSAGSCARSGWCVLAGAIRNRRYFLISERRGAWTRPRPVPGPVGSISCDRTGTCTAVGSRPNGLFAVTERHGTWGTPAIPPGTTGYHPVNGDVADTMVTGLSCSAPGQCAMTGYHASDTYGEYDNID